MKTIDIEIPLSPLISPNLDLKNFLGYLQISVTAELLEQCPTTCNLLVNSFGRKSIVKVGHKADGALDFSDLGGYLYYKIHDSEFLTKLAKLMEIDLQFRIYLLCHNLFDLKLEYKKIKDFGIDLSRVTFILSKFNQSVFIQSESLLQNWNDDSSYSEILFANPQRSLKTKANSTSKSANFIFYFVLRMLRFLITPIKNLNLLVKKSNLIWILRVKELIDFTCYLVLLIRSELGIFKVPSIRAFYMLRHVFLMTGFKSFGVFVDIYQVLRVVLIKVLFKIRHLFLMSGFKSFGVFVDIYQVLRVVLIKVLFKIRHLLLMSGFKSFGVFVDIYQVLRAVLIKLLFKIRHLLLMSGFKSFGIFIDIYQVLRLAVIRSFYITRHVLLMTGFKSFGVFVDSYQFLRLSLIKSFYKIKHVLLMTWFKSFGILVDTYHLGRTCFIKSFYVVRHTILMTVFKFYGTVADLYYSIRHFLLVTGGEVYGLFVDSYYFSIRHLCKLNILLYPFFKMYWFLSYQYKKRIVREL